MFSPEQRLIIIDGDQYTPIFGIDTFAVKLKHFSVKM